MMEAQPRLTPPPDTTQMPTAPLPPDELAGFNVAHAVERMLGEPALWWEAVAMFVQHFADWEAQWQATEGNCEAERRCVHALYSAATNVGADHLACVAASLEALLAKCGNGQNTTLPPGMRWYLRDCFRATWRSAATAQQLTLVDTA